MRHDELSETSIVRAIWEGKAIMGSTADGSVQDPVATSYSFVISISRTDVKPNVRGGGFLPLTAQYLDPSYLKCPEAAAVLAGLS
jgi:hypothetical protein